MLHIHHRDFEPHGKILRVEGSIVTEWTSLLEDECLPLIASGHAVVLDLSRVIFIGRSGIEAIQRLHAAGVRITACPSLIADVLEQEGVPVERVPPHSSHGAREKNHRSP